MECCLRKILVVCVAEVEWPNGIAKRLEFERLRASPRRNSNARNVSRSLTKSCVFVQASFGSPTSSDTHKDTLMKFLLSLSALLATASAFAPTYKRAFVPLRMAAEADDMDAQIQEGKDMRLKHLEEQAMYALKVSVEKYGTFG